MDKKSVIIGIIGIAIIVIILFSIVFLFDNGVEGKWSMEKLETLNDDGSVNETHQIDNDLFWEFRSDGQDFYSDTSGVVEQDESINNVTWEYTGDNEITISTFVISPVSNYTYNNSFEYEQSDDTLTLSYSIPPNNVQQRLTLRRAN